jgi:phage gpG-like protein
MTISFDVSGIGGIQAKLDRLANVGNVLRQAITNGASDVRRVVSTYPSATEANEPPNPPPGTYYKRGTGSIYVYAGAKVRTRKGKKRVAKGGERVVKPSEMLNRRWSTQYTFTANEATAVIGNSASYAPFVHDETKQARFHGARGWQTAQGVVRQLGPRIVKDVSAAIEAELSK